MLWQSMPKTEQDLLRLVWTTQYHHLQGRYRWNRVKGPLTATIATLAHVGWKGAKPDFWWSPEGGGWALPSEPTPLGPLFEDSLLRSITAVNWQKAANHYEGPGLEEGPDLTVPLKIIKQYT